MSEVSVIVPIYNAGIKLEKCIKSILYQTFQEIEVILVNDGSTDNSLEICEKFKKQDDRITLINKENEGSIVTRSRGVNASSCNYIMFVDADDWVDKKLIETLYIESVQNDLDISICNIYRVVGNGLFIKKKVNSWYFNNDKIYHKAEIRSDLITAFFHGHPFPSSLCAKLYKRDLLLNTGKYLKDINFLGDDLFLNLEVMLEANRIKLINKSLYYYRTGGFTSKFQPYLFDDMITGFQIQKKVIDEYYCDTTEQNYNGISIMLLNTYITSLCNLFKGSLSKNEIFAKIEYYVSNDIIKTSTFNKGAINYFPSDYLEAIQNKDIKYLYKLGKVKYIKAIPKKNINNFISKIG